MRPLARTTVWGAGSATQSVAASVTPVLLGALAVQGHTVYGSIAALQQARVGAYADSLVVTIDY